MNLKHALKTTAFLLIATTYSSTSTAVTDEEFKALQNQLNLLADSIEQDSGGQSNTHIGGYGELHYNNLNSTRELDFHRFVIEISHDFSNDIRLFTEFELEHALVADSGSTPGEVELEQAYVQIDLNQNSNINAGVFLLPIGIMNETHEPPTFYGVERNPVEKNIIPATWWEGGVMYSAKSDSGLSYDIALTSGLNGGDNIRGGRQKVAEAVAHNLATTARVKYTGIAGVELAGTIQLQNDLTQNNSDTTEGATLIELHAIINKGPVTVKALAAQWDIDGTGPAALVTDKQDGHYLEASYKLTSGIGIFARHNMWDNGGVGDTEENQTDFGINYWPHEDVVIKADYQLQNAAAGDKDGFNLGVGYQF